MRALRFALPALVSAAACVMAAAPTVVPSSADAAVSPGPRSAVACPPPTVTVATSAQLQRALNQAGPGTVIGLADGVYRGHFDIVESGAVNAPAFLCGSPRAVLHGGSPRSSGYTLHLERASYWRLVGFSIVGGQKGLMADAVTGSMMRNLKVSGSGDEGIHLRSNSTNNVVRGNVVRRTGRREPSYGVGIYVGSAQSSWCTYTDCLPDASNGNRLIGNSIAATTAESVVLSEGTTGGLVFGNLFNGTAMTTGESWLDVKGNGWLVTRNSGRNAPVDGFQTHSVAPGWGVDNTFSRNSAIVNADGYGYNTGQGNRVTCDNTASAAGAGVSSQPCG